MQITEEARRAAAIAVAVEVNGWPGAASLPYHPTDPTVADTMRRITDVALEAAVPLLAPHLPNRHGETVEVDLDAIESDAPQPVDREALEEVMDREICTCQSCEEESGYNEGARAVQKAVLALLNGTAK